MKVADLRKSILQAAVQGKLVPQNLHDEPASELLKRIRKEKARLVKEGKIRKEKPLPPISEDEVPFDLPEGWVWCRLGDLCSYIQRGKSPVYSEVRKYPVVAQKCNQWSGFEIEKARFIDPVTLARYEEVRFLQENDLLWNSTGLGTLGRMAMYETRLNPYGIAVADSHVTVIRPFREYAQSHFLFFYFTNPTVQNVIEEQSDGTTKQKELATSTVRNYLVPLPPLAEQQRIVAKVDELMALCDELKAAEKELDALENNLADYLPKSILQAAIQGKLVQQDPSEEPATELLKRIRMEKSKLVRKGKIKKEKALPSVTEDEMPFDLPERWAWCRLGELCSYIQRGKSPVYSDVEMYPVVAQKCNQWSGFDISKARFIDPTSLAKYDDVRLLRDNDLLWNSTGLGTLGRMAMYETKLNPYGIAVADSHVTVIRPFGEYVLLRYLFFYFSNPTVQNVIENQSDGTTKQKELATSTIKNYPVPLPPFSEQQRIVAKTEELLALCSYLKSNEELPFAMPPKLRVLPSRRTKQAPIAQDDFDDLRMAARGDASRGYSAKAMKAIDALFGDDNDD